ncbi:MAG: MBL fold metallo-hydrolase [Spartobacteria bacterium]|nr:MBL fold metallo-hydrolase [Spartobacteria bacterium]
MSFQLCVLASGSSGNCTYIGTDTTRILIDAGLSGRETGRRLAQIGVSVEQIDGICVTHEHTDHTNGLGVLHKRHGIPIFVNGGTIEGLQRGKKAVTGVNWTVFTTGSPFFIGEFAIEPFSVPHDAYEPVGFIIHTECVRIGVVTDMGLATTLIRQRLKDCDVVVLESNHDEQLLEQAARPWSLKQRIRGRQGHLSNRHAGEVVQEIACPRLKRVYLAHLSSDCNRQDLAEREIRGVLAKTIHQHIEVTCTFADRISEVWSHSAL